MPYPHSFIKLTEEERKTVSRKLSEFNQAGKYKKRRRLQVLWFSNQGITYEQISKKTDLSYQRVRELIYLYRKEGLKPFI